MLVAQKVAVGVYKGVTTSELDELAAETAASMTSKHPDYAQVRFRARLRTRRDPARRSPTTSRRALFSEGSGCLRKQYAFQTLWANPADALSPPHLRSSPLASPSPTSTRIPRSPSRRRACPNRRPSPVSGDASREYSNPKIASKRERFKYSKPEDLSRD